MRLLLDDLLFKFSCHRISHVPSILFSRSLTSFSKDTSALSKRSSSFLYHSSVKLHETPLWTNSKIALLLIGFCVHFSLQSYQSIFVATVACVCSTFIGEIIIKENVQNIIFHIYMHHMKSKSVSIIYIS